MRLPVPDASAAALNRFERMAHDGVDVEPSLRTHDIIRAKGEDRPPVNLCDVGLHSLS
ncbi:MAG: hypothetical protein JJE37_07395 [Methyloceanibacter sp.]|nr:hypothetical protein [Methyloceanibacter sp.]